MSRQNRNIERERKSGDPKRDADNSNDRSYSRNNREEPRNERERGETGYTSELDRYRLNDLYERSSL